MGDPAGPDSTSSSPSPGDGTLGVIVIWVFTAAAIVKYFSREPAAEHIFKTLVAPEISGLGLAWVVVLLLEDWGPTGPACRQLGQIPASDDRGGRFW